MNNADYWKQRFTQLETAQHRKGATAYLEMERQYKEAQRQLEGQIARWYQRFADNNGISLAQAKQWLKGDDLAEFKWDVKAYIQHGKENAINGAWMQELENASAKYHISKLEALKIQTQNSLETMFAKQFGTMKKTLSDVYATGYYHTAYEVQRGFKIGWGIAGLDQAQIEKVLAKPWAVDGYNFSERIWGNKTKLISEVHNELSQNIMLGADPQKAIDSLAKKMNTSKNNAGRLVMTEEAYFSSAAQKDCFKSLDVEQYEIVATLDSHTSDICRNLDGKHFPMKDHQPGVTAPPFHVGCRSTTVPYFDEQFDIGERAARGEDGKTYYVPADMTYKEWEKAFVESSPESVDELGGNDIIRESNKKSITPISDNAIERVPEVKIPGYTEEQCVFIQDQHKELLKYSRDNNENKEVAFVFDGSLTNRKEFKGSDDRLDFGSSLYGKDLFVMHNHPRNSSYSLNDIIEFISNDSIKTLTIVKNNGGVETLTKLSEINAVAMLKEIQRLERNNVKTKSDSEYRKIIAKFLNKHDKGGILKWNK